MLQRHLEVLDLVLLNEPIGIINLAKLSKLPEHKVRYSLHFLEENGLITPTPKGATFTGDSIKLRRELDNLKKQLQKTLDIYEEFIKSQ